MHNNSSFSPFFPVMKTCVSVQTVLCFKLFLAVVTKISRCVNVSLNMLLHIILQGVTISTCNTKEPSISLVLNERLYLLVHPIRTLTPGWKRTQFNYYLITFYASKVNTISKQDSIRIIFQNTFLCT